MLGMEGRRVLRDADGEGCRAAGRRRGRQRQQDRGDAQLHSAASFAFASPTPPCATDQPPDSPGTSALPSAPRRRNTALSRHTSSTSHQVTGGAGSAPFPSASRRSQGRRRSKTPRRCGVADRAPPRAAHSRSGFLNRRRWSGPRPSGCAGRPAPRLDQRVAARSPSASSDIRHRRHHPIGDPGAEGNARRLSPPHHHVDRFRSPRAGRSSRRRAP